MRATLAQQVDLRAIGPEQAGGIGHGAVEHRLRLVQGRDVGRDLGQAALGVHPGPQLLDQAGVGDRHRGLAGEELDELEVGIGEGDLGATGARDVHGADNLVAADERHDDHRLLLLDRAGNLDDARVVERVVEEHRLAVLDAPPGEAAAALDRERQDGLGIAVTGEHRGEDLHLVVDAVDAEVVGPDHALQAVGDQVEHRRRVQGAQQPLVDLEQALLRVGQAGERRGLLAELVVQPGIGDGDGRLVGEGAEQLLPGLVEGVDPARLHGQRAEASGAADQRGGHHRAHAAALDVLVELIAVGEGRVVEVVPGAPDPPLGHRHAADALAHADRDVVGRPVGRGVGDRPAEERVVVLERVDDRGVGVEQAQRLLRRALKDGGRIVEGGDLGADGGQGLLGVDALAQLLVQAGVVDRDRRLAGEDLEELLVRGVEGIAGLRVHGQ